LGVQEGHLAHNKRVLLIPRSSIPAQAEKETEGTDKAMFTWQKAVKMEIVMDVICH